VASGWRFGEGESLSPYMRDWLGPVAAVPKAFHLGFAKRRSRNQIVLVLVLEGVTDCQPVRIACFFVDRQFNPQTQRCGRAAPCRRPILIATPLHQSLTWCTSVKIRIPKGAAAT
jgi:hypothetical protein